MDRPLAPLAAAVIAACAPAQPPAAERGEAAADPAIPDDRGRVLRGEDAELTTDWPARVTRTPFAEQPVEEQPVEEQPVEDQPGAARDSAPAEGARPPR